MRSVWCIVVAVGLLAAGGQHHTGTSELHAAQTPVVVATRRAAYRHHLAPFTPAATRGVVVVPRIAITDPGAASARPIAVDRPSSRSSRGPPRA
jgi:hypothetical protein